MKKLILLLLIAFSANATIHDIVYRLNEDAMVNGPCRRHATKKVCHNQQICRTVCTAAGAAIGSRVGGSRGAAAGVGGATNVCNEVCSYVPKCMDVIICAEYY